MMKKGYIVRLTVAFGLMAIGVILGYESYLSEFTLGLACSYALFGVGAVVTTYTEMKRLEGLA